MCLTGTVKEFLDKKHDVSGSECSNFLSKHFSDTTGERTSVKYTVLTLSVPLGKIMILQEFTQSFGTIKKKFFKHYAFRVTLMIKTFEIRVS